MGINYSQCWEDQTVLTKALNVNKEDVVLSIASGGDNTFALLLQEPISVTAIDKNPAQIYLLELKLVAIQQLNYQTFREFLGVDESSKRIDTFLEIKSQLSGQARIYWEDNLEDISLGIIHCGRFEKFLAFFRRRVLPWVQSKRNINKMLACITMNNQNDFYDNVWNHWRWKLMFKLCFNKLTIKNFARAPGSFDGVERISSSKHYYLRTQHALINTPVNNNYFLNYILTGRYGGEFPEYLKQENFQKLKQLVDRIELISQPLDKYLISKTRKDFTKYNLSDIFETVNDSNLILTFQQIIKATKNNARLIYWNHFIAKQHPSKFDHSITLDKVIASELHQVDRGFFYSRLVVESINK